MKLYDVIVFYSLKPGIFEILFVLHCVKSVQIRSFFWSLFPCIRTEYGDLRSKWNGIEMEH